MSKAKSASFKDYIPKEFPIPLVEEYTNNCERLKKYESAVIKRFAPKLPDILQEFVRLTYIFDESFLPEYAALAFMGAARCEKIQEHHIVERHYLLKAAEAFLKAYNRRFELGYTRGEEEYRQGALRCYDEILQNPNLPKNSFIRATVIRQLKTIDPETNETSTFESPLLRYEDLKRAAIYDMQEEHYTNALNKLTDISDDITERKKEKFHHTVLEYSETTRLLLLLHLEMPPAALAPSNAALLERYRYNPEVCPSVRAKESALDPELFLMFRGFVQGIQLHSVEYMTDAFNDLGTMEFFSDDQHKLLRLSFRKFKQRFEIEEADMQCKCLKPEEDEEETEVLEDDTVEEEWIEEPLTPELEALVKDLEEMEKRYRTLSEFQWYLRAEEAEKNATEEVKRSINPCPDEPEETNLNKILEKIQGKENPEVKDENWVDPLTEALSTTKID